MTKSRSGFGTGGHIILLAGLLIALLASTAESQERMISLREALEISMEGNPGIRASGESLLAQKEDIGIARSFLLPRITFEERFMRTNNPTYAFMAKLNQGRFGQQDFAVSSLNNPEAINDFQTGVSFEQPLFAPKAYIGMDFAREEFTAKSGDFQRKREEVAFGVFKAYLGIQTAKAYVATGEKGVEDAKEHLRIADVRYNAGTGLYSDLLRVQVAVASAEARLVTARKNLEIGKRALGLMLGLAESVDAGDERPVFELRPPEHYSGAASSRKDIKSLEARYRNATNSLKMADAGYLPVVGVGGSVQMNSHRKPFGDEGDSWQMIAFLRWELFDGMKREYERKKARHVIDEAGAYLDGLRKQASFEVYEAYLSVGEAEKSLELSRTALSFAEEGKRLVEVRYENSLSTMVELLDIQTSLDTARARVVEKEAAYLTSVAGLGFQSGTILRDLGVEK